jgi:lysophospholipase
MTSTFDRRVLPPGIRIGEWTARDGWPIRRFDWEPEGAARGSLLFQAGRGDFIEKYLESKAHWHRACWRLTGFDWRGQGGSGRLLPDPLVGHLPSLDPLLDDLDAFVVDWVERTPPPHVLVGHSMGGHLMLRLLAEKDRPVEAAVLVAPMLGLNSGPIPPAAGRFLARLACRLGLSRRGAWKQDDRPASINHRRQTNLTSSIERYADEQWWKDARPELAIGPPSWGWLAAAYMSIALLDRPGAMEKVKVPTLLLGAEKDRLVSREAIARAAARIPHARLIMSHESAHEMLREADAVRLPLLAEIDRFLDETAPLR